MDKQEELLDGYRDPRLAALYDTFNPHAADTDFYLNLAAELGIRTVLDVGCGTGLLAAELAQGGFQVTGLDPAPAMLDIARARSERVRWVESTTAKLSQQQTFDLALMTGHVAQVFLTAEDWRANLKAIRLALNPGGYLAFESRNPAARAWEGWTEAASRQLITLPDGRTLDDWYQVMDVQGDLVTFESVSRWPDTGERWLTRDTLRFASQEDLETSLIECGFTVRAVYGDWQGQPVTPHSPELIFLAQA